MIARSDLRPDTVVIPVPVQSDLVIRQFYPHVDGRLLSELAREGNLKLPCRAHDVSFKCLPAYLYGPSGAKRR